MKHYINTNKELFGVEQGQEFLIQPDWVEVSLEEIEAMNKAKEDEYKSSIEYKVQEAKQYLAKTDNREFPSYIPKDGENVAETIAKRVEARQFIRENR